MCDAKQNKLKKEILYKFFTMTIPMRQWFNYIVPDDYAFLKIKTKELIPPDILKIKSFVIWFQTIIDVLKEENDIEKILKERIWKGTYSILY